MMMTPDDNKIVDQFGRPVQAETTLRKWRKTYSKLALQTAAIAALFSGITALLVNLQKIDDFLHRGMLRTVAISPFKSGSRLGVDILLTNEGNLPIAITNLHLAFSQVWEHPLLDAIASHAYDVAGTVDTSGRISGTAQPTPEANKNVHIEYRVTGSIVFSSPGWDFDLIIPLRNEIDATHSFSVQVLLPDALKVVREHKFGTSELGSILGADLFRIPQEFFEHEDHLKLTEYLRSRGAMNVVAVVSHGNGKRSSHRDSLKFQ